MTETPIQPACPARASVSWRWHAVAVFVLLLLAGGTRFIGLGDHDPWVDEVHSYEDSTDLVARHLRWSTNIIHSPLIYLEIKIARQVLGDNKLSLRLPSALHGCLAVVLLYCFVGPWFGWRAAVMAAGLLAVSPFALDWSRDARMYNQWLSSALLLAIAAASALRRVDAGKATALDWRFWFIGVLFGLMHASAVFAVTTLGAIGLWLGGVGVIGAMTRGRRYLHLVGGAAVATGVYLTSWSVIGLHRVLTNVASDSGGKGSVTAGHFVDAFLTGLSETAGYVPAWWAVPLWLAAVAGLAFAVRRAGWPVVLLVLLVGLLPWMSFKSIASRHFFAGRYVYVSLIPFCIGLAIWLGWLIDRHGRRGLLITAVACLGLVGMWGPSYNQVYRHPRSNFGDALLPIQQHAVAGDVMVIYPESFIHLGSFFRFGEARVMAGPPAARESNPNLYSEYAASNKAAKRVAFDTSFEQAFVGEPPAACWLFLVIGQEDGSPRRTDIAALYEPILTAYGLTVGDLLAVWPTGEAQTFTARLSADGVDHVRVTPGGKRGW